MDVASRELMPSDAMRATAGAWFNATPLEFAPLSGAGFSGAVLAKLRPVGSSDWFVLKAFAAGTDRIRAEWIHGFVRHGAAAGITELPQPRATSDGETVFTDATGVHWELVPFMAGRPSEAPNPAQAAAALRVLARIHVAAAALPGATVRRGPPPAVLRRRAQAAALMALPWSRRRTDATVSPNDAMAADVAERWRRAVAVFDSAGGRHAVAAIADVAAADVPLLPVLRDVWSAHVLFAAGDVPRVAGIVDVHAAAIDTPATDLARLLGSWRRLDAAPQPDLIAMWPEAIAAYAAVRPPSTPELTLVPFLHAAGVVCGLDNWFRWTLEERRSFADPAAALARIDRLLQDLPTALEWLAGSAIGSRLTRGNCSL